jgi:hypothetical protein
MRLFKAWAIAIAATVLCCAGARADLVIGPVSRSIMAAAGAGPTPVGGSDSSAATGLYSPAPIMVVDSDVGGIIEAHASQSSSTPLVSGPSMGGIGDAGGSTLPGPGPGGFSLTGDSFFDVVFMVDIDGLFLFDGDVSWTGPAPPMGGGAIVRLEELVPMAPAIPIASVSKSVASPGAASLTTTVTLLMGKSYRLFANAHVDGGGAPGAFAGAASYAFTLTAVPETGAWLLTAPIALGLAIVAWRRRRQPRVEDPPRRAA